MNKKRIISYIVCICIGLLLGFSINNYTYITKKPSSHTGHDMKMMSYLGDRGPDFDKKFIDGMILHHEGALEMAHVALNNSDRQEIKKLSNEIIMAQKKEIEQMKKWRKEWYE